MKFKIWIKNLSSLTVGGSTDLGEVDVPMNRMGFPASSVKGAMRTALHRAVKEWGEEMKEYNLRLTSCGEIDPDFMKRAHRGKPCDVCNLFGTPSSSVEGRSRVRIYQVEVPNEVHKLTRVSIDRKTRTKREGALFSQEVYKPKEVFQFEIELEDPRDHDLTMVLLSLLYMRYFRVGRGGMIDVKVENPCSNGCDEFTKKLAERLGEWEVEI
ncbi:RAMP superfamily CRISPR-associated protein [Metallosphaera hakonensis]|uniref:CRISPR type III-associated protein domain-containing protein n=1 Tax=Metallosphaera hakonensis JCM 8857 = DSM 7519 TaxID=1293036 RepID=A0A2U9IRN0_9CREN|nr:RAMP superfamily CRISPR-associated protein [Metallosphaera hakonensis]AWR98665.1 hypothetical protein DFR87_01935 [Metallosphaera hakonensis JCM 8857 = DSM 7519]